MLTLLTQFTLNIRDREDDISHLNDFGETVEGMIRAVLFFGALLTFGYMVWGGIDWITAAGDQGKIESARKKITQSIIGLAVLASVGVIFLVVQYVLGLDVMTFGGGGTQNTCTGSNNCLIP